MKSSFHYFGILPLLILPSVLASDKKRWPGGHVFYDLDRSLALRDMEEVYKAFEEYQRKTCVRFLEDDYSALSNTSHLRFELDNNVCSSSTVCGQEGSNYIKFGKWCRDTNRIVFELAQILCMNDPNILMLRKRLNSKRLHGLSVINVDYINELYDCGGCFRHRWIPIQQMSEHHKRHLPVGQISPCRAFLGDRVVIGTYDPADASCFVSLNGKKGELTLKGFELLTIPGGVKTDDSEYFWAEAYPEMLDLELDALFANAVPAGQLSSNQNLEHYTAYIGYTQVKNPCEDHTIHLLGSVWRDFGVIRSDFLTKGCNMEVKPEKIKVLACQSLGVSRILPEMSLFGRRYMLLDTFKNRKLRYLKLISTSDHHGFKIQIQGRILPKASNIFVDLANSPAAGSLSISLHFQFSSKAPAVLITNSDWNTEHNFTLNSNIVVGSSYKLEIINYGISGFAIAVNNYFITEIGHRGQLDKTFFRVYGDTIISDFNLEKMTLSTFGDRTSSVYATTTNESSNIYSHRLRCGGILRNENAEIVYKPNVQILPNERCVWIVAAPSASMYVISILQLGNSINTLGSNTVLEIMGDEYHSKPENEITAGFKSRIILITFASGDRVERSTGFVLQYNTIAFDSVTVSSHHICDIDVPSFKYPIFSEKYQNFENAWFVFAPKNNIYSGVRKQFTYIRDGLEGDGCMDNLSVFSFNRNGWTRTDVICGNISRAQKEHDNLLMVNFWSTDVNTNTGFRLIDVTL